MSEASFEGADWLTDNVLISDQATYAQEAGRDDVALEGFTDAVTFFRQHRQGLPTHTAMRVHSAPVQHPYASQQRQVPMGAISGSLVV